MAGYIKKNNEFIPLTGDGYGLPLGTIIAVYSNLVPDGYLPCNGATFDTTTYAALYAYLGSNKLPDSRECVLVGAGQSDNEYDANDNPTGIQVHDVYIVGQFKDDQIQNITASYKGYNIHENVQGAFEAYTGKDNSANVSSSYPSTSLKFDASRVARTGTTTHGKQMGVNYCIKATPAYVEPDTVSDMVHTMRVQDSYSTEEVNTGKTWIDGKPIYRKVINDTITIAIADGGFNHGITNLDTLTFFDMFNTKGSARYYAQVRGITSTQIQTYNLKSYAFTVDTIILEYTKTTD